MKRINLKKVCSDFCRTNIQTTESKVLYSYIGEIPLQFFFSGQAKATFVPHTITENTFLEAVEAATNDSLKDLNRSFEHHLKTVSK